jgi:hypothetical protein
MTKTRFAPKPPAAPLNVVVDLSHHNVDPLARRPVVRADVSLT